MLSDGGGGKGGYQVEKEAGEQDGGGDDDEGRWGMRAGRGGQRGETVETKAGWPPPEHTYSLQRRRESS